MIAGLIIGFALVAGFVYLCARSRSKDDRRLRAAPSGSRRIESVKTTWLNQTVRRYAAAGWTVEQQSSAKSLGRTAQVTVTFVKA